MTKEEIEQRFKEFTELWNIQLSFAKAFDSLRKGRITYMFDDYWAISSDDPIVLLQKFLGFKDVQNYYGIETALFLNRKAWQTPLTYYLLNTAYDRKRKFKGITVQLVKIPEKIFNDSTLIEDVLIYSDYEKTILDMVFFKKQKFPYPENFSKINLYLGLFTDYGYVKRDLISRLNEKERKLVR